MATGVRKQIMDSYMRSVNLALAEVERRARKLLNDHQNLDEFIMGMGIASFTVKGSEWSVDDTDLKYLKPVLDFIRDWDEYLKLTGEPVRFTATGPRITSW